MFLEYSMWLVPNSYLLDSKSYKNLSDVDCYDGCDCFMPLS